MTLKRLSSLCKKYMSIVCIELRRSLGLLKTRFIFIALMSSGVFPKSPESKLPVKNDGHMDSILVRKVSTRFTGSRTE